MVQRMFKLLGCIPWLLLLASQRINAASFHRPTFIRVTHDWDDKWLGPLRQSLCLRGGDQGESMTLDEKVFAAMRKLGLSTPKDLQEGEAEGEEDVTESHRIPTLPVNECPDGVCPVPDLSNSLAAPVTTAEDPQQIADRIAAEMGVDKSIAWAALGATSGMGTPNPSDRTYNESAARDMIQQELDMVAQIPEDSEEVQQLVSEGFDVFLSRRALAFAERDMQDARAILVADEMDEKEEMERLEQLADEPVSLKTVSIETSFDPTKVANPETATTSLSQTPPTSAKKSDVVFEATASDIQKLVLESPVPVLMDIYATWCGPCKVLTPILEELAVKSGGVFRLVKVDSDKEPSVSKALDVTALPSVFAFRDGKILHSFQGIPRSESAIKSFMMGLLLPGANFDPPVSENEKKKYAEMSTKLIKMAGVAAFPFSARERLQDRVVSQLDKLIEQSGDVSIAEEAAQTLRILFSNIIRDPYEAKFRKVNLSNKIISEKIGKYPAGVAVLKGVGFVLGRDDETMILGKGKRVVNVAPLSIAAQSIEKWIDKRRYEVAAALRKRNDELARKKLHAEAKTIVIEQEEAEMEQRHDLDACRIRLRIDGKKKVHEIVMQADERLKSIVQKLPVKISPDEEYQITCVAKRLTIKSTENGRLEQSLRELGLTPSATLVVSLGGKAGASGASSLSERAATKKKIRKGSHTMQSVGIYSKDDNAKAELIDGGGGVWYEHDVSDDEDTVPTDADDDNENTAGVQDFREDDGEGADKPAMDT